MKPIGYFRSSIKNKAEAPRQGSLGKCHGVLELCSGQNFEQALAGLEGFKRIWLLFDFHQNENWKPMVLPQRSEKKVGVFATRSPYRPNQIGLSCVKLDKVEKLKLYLSETDLVDGTPIYDIKPYMSYVDSFSEADSKSENCWWQEPVIFSIGWSEKALKKRQWILENSDWDLEAFAAAQLSTEPYGGAAKRIQQVDGQWEFSCKTWKLLFEIDEENHLIQIKDICSRLSEMDCEEMIEGVENSVQFHKKFLADF